MKNITLSADEKVIEAARARARDEHTTLNSQFRQWLSMNARARSKIQQYDAVLSELKGKVSVGRRLSRDEMNER